MAYAGPVWHYGERKTTNRIWVQQPTKKKKKKREIKPTDFYCSIESFSLQTSRERKRKKTKRLQNDISVTFANLPWTADGLSFSVDKEVDCYPQAVRQYVYQTTKMPPMSTFLCQPAMQRFCRKRYDLDPTAPCLSGRNSVFQPIQRHF